MTASRLDVKGEAPLTGTRGLISYLADEVAVRRGEIMAKLRKTSLGRRGFLKNAAGAAALVTTTPLVEAQAPGNRTGAAPAAGAVPAPTDAQLARDAGNVRPPAVPARTITRAGSDLMVQAVRDLGIEYVAANPDQASKASRSRSLITVIRPTRCRSSSPRSTKNPP